MEAVLISLINSSCSSLTESTSEHKGALGTHHLLLKNNETDGWWRSGGNFKFI
jgi:hypothetical protein